MERKRDPSIQQETIPMLNVYQRVLAVMADIDYIQKGSKTVNGQYRFTSHDQVTAALHPHLVKHRLAVIPSMQDIVQEGNRTQIKLFVRFINVDNPIDEFTVSYPGYGVDSSDKGPGKAISYAYKYALLKTFNLETGDDPDNDVNACYEPPKCLEFDFLLPTMTDKEMAKLDKFLAHSSLSLKKHIEDVKREAVTRMDSFLKAFRAWTSKKQGEGS